MLYLAHLVSKSNSVHSGRDSQVSMSEAWARKRVQKARFLLPPSTLTSPCTVLWLLVTNPSGVPRT